VFTDDEWASFRNVVGEPWTADGRFSTLMVRKQNEDELERLIGAWTVNYTAEDLMEKLQAVGVAAGVAQNEQNLHGDPQLQHRGHFHHLAQGGVDDVAFTGPPMRFSKAVCEMRPAPGLGEHNEWVLKKILRMPDDEIADVAAAGVLQ
jgi:benzylsuccinate CoA-transferase BbsF subunit